MFLFFSYLGYKNFQLPLIQGPFNMEVSSTILLLTQGTTAKQWGQNVFEGVFEFLKSNDYRGVPI